MNANAYELLSLAMRYVFAGLMALIVLRAWRITSVDSRRAARLRRLSPDTGIIGEMLVVNGSERARPGMRYPVTLEGTIGSGRRSDIRIRHSSVRSRHAIFMMTDEGLFVRGHAQARIRDGRGHLARQLVLHDGEILRIGEVALMLVLTEAGSAPEEISRRVRRRRDRLRRDDTGTDFTPDFANEFGEDFEYDPAEEIPALSEEEIRRLDREYGFKGAGDDLFDLQTDADDLFMSNPAGRFENAAYDEYDEYDDL